MGVASIKVNGVEYCHKRVGHNVVVLDPAGEFVASENFDTTAPEGGVAMGKFLDELPEDHIVLVATQETTGAFYQLQPLIIIVVVMSLTV